MNHNKQTSNAPQSTPTGSRFLNFFSSSTSNQIPQKIHGYPPSKKPTQDIEKHINLNHNPLKMYGDPPSKKPKLDNMDKHVNLSQSLTSSKKIKTNGDLYDELLWGDDDADLEIALSQIPETTLSETKNQNITMGFSNQGSTVTKNMKRPTESNNSNIIAANNSQRGVPLRRTASSGWPPTNNFGRGNNSQSGVKTLNTNFEQLTFENNNLKAELTKKVEELTRKSGEVHLLRDKYSHVQLELDKQRKEYLEKFEKLKQEAEANTLRLTRELKSLQSQLDVKDMEIDSAERRTQHLTSVNRLLPESPHISRTKISPARVNHTQNQKKDVICGRGLRTKSLPLELMQEIITPELLKPSPPETTIIKSVCTITNTGLFSGPKEVKPLEASTSRNLSTSTYVTANTSIKNILTAVSQPLSMPCSSVEQCALILLSSSLLDVSSGNSHQIISQVLATCVLILKNQFHQLNSAVCPQNQYIEREREIMYYGYKYLVLSQNYDLLSCREIYNDERGICARRALALLSLLVEVSTFAAEEILPRSKQISDKKLDDTSDMCSEDDDPHQILIIIKDIIHQIEKQRRTLMFEGVLAAATAVVNNLLQLDISLTSHSQEILFDILKLVVFARPGSLVIENILRALVAATKYPYIINRMCHNSAKKTYVENTRSSEITYSQETCLLQVLCMLIRLLETPKKHILSDLFTSWVLTLFYSMEQSPKWLYSVPSQTSCQCRRLISRLTFILLGEACFIYPTVSDGGIKRKLDLLFSRGILLVCTLLYHDENFGANVDPASVGYYEFFLHSIVRNMDKIHNKACWDMLNSLWCREEIREPMSKYDGQNPHFSSLSPLYSNQGVKNCNVLDSLDEC